MSAYNQEELKEMAYQSWKDEADEQLKYIKKHVDNGMVKFENVMDLGYEMHCFLRMSGDFDNGDDRVYDYTDEAKQMLDDLRISFVQLG
jgi:hypothetical protein